MAKLEFHLQEAIDIIKKQKNNQIKDIELENEKIRLKSTFGTFIISWDEFRDNKLIFDVRPDTFSLKGHIANWVKSCTWFKKKIYKYNLEYENNKIYIDLNKISIPINVESVIQKNQNIIIEGKIL